MRTLKPTWLLALTAAALLTPEGLAGETPISGDLARLQGRWVTRAGPRRKMLVTLEIEGNKAHVLIATPQGAKIKAEGELRVNEATSPRTIDWIGFTSLDSQDLPDVPGIYEWQGDSFRVCNGGPNATRPSAFERGAGMLADIHVFERVKLANASADPLTDQSRQKRSE